MEQQRKSRSTLERGESTAEDSPVEFVTVADSDASAPGTPEKKPKKKRGLSFKKLRSNAQKLIPGVRRGSSSSSKKSSETTSSSVADGESVSIDRNMDTPSPPPPASPTPSAPSPEPTRDESVVKSTESLPAIKEDPREALAAAAAANTGARSDEDMLATEEKQRQKKTRKPSRAASFMKKLAGRGKSAKVAPNSPTAAQAPRPSPGDEGDGLSAGTLETPLSIKRQTPEGAILNAATSDAELYSDDGTSVDPPPLAIRELEAEPRPLLLRRTGTPLSGDEGGAGVGGSTDIEFYDDDDEGTATAIETSNGRLLRVRRRDENDDVVGGRRAGGGGGGRVLTTDLDGKSNQNEALSLSAKPISPFVRTSLQSLSATAPTTTTTTMIVDDGGGRPASLTVTKESFGVEQPTVTIRTQEQQQKQDRLSSLLSGDYIAEINKFSIENIAPPPPVPSPRTSLSIRERFFQSALPPPPPPVQAPSSPVVGDEENEDFMRKSKGGAGAAAAAGRSKGSGKGSSGGSNASVAAATATSVEPAGGGSTSVTVRTQEAAKPYQLGNSLKNPNNSGFKSVEPATRVSSAGGLQEPQQEQQRPEQEQQRPEPEQTRAGDGADEAEPTVGDGDGDPQPQIVFDIGTQVRPDRTSSNLVIGASGSTLTVPPIRLPVTVDGDSSSAPLSGTYASIGTEGSIGAGSVGGGGSGSGGAGGGLSSYDDSSLRRRIAYVEQPTFYTPEEEELLTGKRPSLSSSGGPFETSAEYSLESEDYLESKMSPHGDLLIGGDRADQSANMAASPAEKREHLYKILVIGELGTGKTSFIKRYVHQFFSQNYRATIGVDFALKVLNWDQNTIIRLQLWDIAGQERFGNMTRVYYKEAVGAFIVFDVTRSATFDAVIKWKQDLDSKVQLPDGKPIPCILLANKSDQQKQGIVTTPAKLDEYVKEHGFAGWFETSAKENVNIEEAAKSLVNKILMNDKMLNTGEIVDSERFALAGGGGGKADINPKKSCAC
ncbi:ras-related protein Rab-44 isoform X1 [Anopheles darlingi]|uniref:ras-related protein Rab-44 isoform X1 n=1 Tax=Anopheles darlingi TaxID=43151 RepID=UPI0021001514|nr:ras-related protein Rab-44 isoform X1 [Anopheles darlingi]